MLSASASAQSQSGSSLSSSGDSSEGSPSDWSTFHKCFCWDPETNSFCDGRTPANFWKTQDCSSWVMDSFWWLPALIIAFALTVIFPCCFYCTRCVCNCCGGRHSSHGCCCPQNREFSGYSNSSIITAKGIFLVVLITTGGLFAFTYTKNRNLDGSVFSATAAVDSLVTNVSGTLMSAVQAVESYESGSSPLGVPISIPAYMNSKINSAASSISEYSNDVKSSIITVNHFEKWGRWLAVDAVMAFAALLLVVGLLLCVCNVRQGIGIVMVLFCMYLVLSLVVLLPNQMLNVVVREVCDNWQGMLLPTAIREIRFNQACDNSGLANELVAVHDQLSSVVTDASGQFCEYYKQACVSTAACQQTTCSDWASYGNGVQLVAIPADLDGAVTLLQALIAPFKSNTGTQSATLVQFAFSYIGPLVPIFEATVRLSNCTQISEMLQTTLYPALCEGSVSARFHELVAAEVGLYFVGLATLVALILGMKRFRALDSYKMYDEYGSITTVLMQEEINGESRAVVYQTLS
jgi:hypothetical protein